MSPLGPNFFLVGAPKCGTTALDNYLGQHPDIFMAPKEQHFFGSDLDEVRRIPGSRPDRKPSPEKYFGFFAAAPDAIRRGDSSVWYLYSRRAAQEIFEYCASARIIVMLRNPLDMLQSLHSQFLHDAIEDIPDFAEAINAEPDRRAGRRVPPIHGPVPWRLFYRDIVRFHEQLARYLDIFGREQVMVILFDDFASQPGTVYAQVLEFLGVDRGYAPEFRVVNPNKRVRSRRVQQLTWDLWDPSFPVRRVGTRLIPVRRVRSALLQHGIPLIRRLNTSHPPRPALGADSRAQLASELAPDIDRLAELIGRDLSAWHAPDLAHSLS
jgi:hypothetical protein